MERRGGGVGCVWGGGGGVECVGEEREWRERGGVCGGGEGVEGEGVCVHMMGEGSGL